MLEIIHIDIELSELVPKRKMNQIVRDALKGALRSYINTEYGRHFKDVPETQPGGEYGYKPRNKQYEERKQRAKGHTNPNEFSGDAKKFVRNNAKYPGTKDSASAIIRWPYPLTAERRAQLNKELTALGKRDREFIEEKVLSQVSREVSKPKNQKKRKRRI